MHNSEYVPVPPARTPEQLSLGLQYANQLRKIRASDKKRIKARRMDARDILLNPPIYWQDVKIAELLCSVPAVSKTKTEKILKELGISPSRTLSGLTSNQISRLNSALTKYYTKPLR